MLKDKLALVVCLHGNEPIGLAVKEHFEGKIPVFIGNPEAVYKKVRYLDADLNRIFPGKPDGNREEKLAFELSKKLEKFEYVLDIHSTSSTVELFAIVTNLEKSKIELIKRMGINKVVFMNEAMASGGSLIDHVKCGISLELGPHENPEIAIDVIQKIEYLLNSGKKLDKLEVFEVFQFIKISEKNLNLMIKNFQEVKKGQLIARGSKEYYAEFDFVPVLVGEKAYHDIICLASKKINYKF